MSELMDAGKRGLLGQAEIPFVNPREGWCFFQLAGDALLTLDNEISPLAKGKGQEIVEAMRCLPAGRHVLKVAGQPQRLIVRAIPALVYNYYQSSTQIAPFGKQTWEILQKEVLPNCNTIESYRAYSEEMTQWRAEGKHWLIHAAPPGLNPSRAAESEDAYEFWQKNLGYAHPLTSGIQVDEFNPGTRKAIPDSIAGMARLAADPAFRGRQVIPFVAGMAGKPDGAELIEAVLKAGWPFSIELYLPEHSTETANRRYLLDALVGQGHAYEKTAPGCLRKAIITLMYSSLPISMTNNCPEANFKVHLDVQMEMLANNPVFAGLYGVQFYRAPYADPDTLRCSARLLRHYCIEGRKKRCFPDPYELKHLLNPDFKNGTAHWELEPAEQDGISTGTHLGYGKLQGRFQFNGPFPQTFLVTKRSPTKPNAFSQQIKHLQPGRLYSLKMITTDYGDLQQGVSRETLHAVSIRLEGVEPQTGPQDAFSCPFRSEAPVANFSGKNPLWMNYHWRVFRAKSSLARLTVTDWKYAFHPDAPASQRIAFNFLELQPYLGEAD